MRSFKFRTFYFALGFLSLSMGIIGAFLPILPTTPFVILAAGFFSKSSPKFYRYLIKHPKYGDQIKNWYDYHIIPKKIKCIAIISILISFSSILIYLAIPWWGKIGLVSVGIYAIYFISSCPTKV